MVCAGCGDEVLETIRICPACGSREFSPVVRPSVPPPLAAPVAATLFPPPPTPAPVRRAPPRGLLAIGAVGGALAAIGLAIFLWPHLRSAPHAVAGLVFDTHDPFTLAIATTMSFGTAEVPWPFAPVELAMSSGGAEQKRWTATADEEGHVSFDLHELWIDAGPPSGGVATFTATARWKNADVVATREVSQGEIGLVIEHLLETNPRVEDLQRALVWQPDSRVLWKALADASTSAADNANAIYAWREWLLSPNPNPEPGEDDDGRDVRARVVEIAKAMSPRPGLTADSIALLEKSQSAAAEGNFVQAYVLAVAAENAAPWSKETYERAGAIALTIWSRIADPSNDEIPEIDSWDLDQATALGSDSAAAMLDQAREQRTKIERAKEAQAELGEIMRQAFPSRSE